MQNKKSLKETSRAMLAATLLSCATANSHAQLPIPVIGNFLGSDMLSGLGGLGVTDLANLDQGALQQMLSPASIGDPTSYLSALEGLLTIAQSPSTFTPIPLAPPLLEGFVPGFFVLYREPQNLLGFLLGGGSFIDSSLVAVPPIPILSSPIPLELPVQDLPGLSGGELNGFPAPQDILSQILSLAP